jgi:hypothetical protein
MTSDKLPTIDGREPRVRKANEGRYAIDAGSDTGYRLCRDGVWRGWFTEIDAKTHEWIWPTRESAEQFVRDVAAREAASQTTADLPTGPGVWVREGKCYLVYNGGLKDQFGNPYMREILATSLSPASIPRVNWPRGGWEQFVPSGEVERLRGEIAELKEANEGHGKPCHYCGKPCSSVSGSPSLWPVALCRPDNPGVVRWHHTGCVSERLMALDAAQAELATLCQQLEVTPGKG